MDPRSANTSELLPHRILAVADWDLDPRVVAGSLRERSVAEPTEVSLLVPSRLPGLAWVGDPHASRPCATEQLAALERLCRRLGVRVATGTVGDPERLPAITSALDAWPAETVLLFERDRRALAHPLRLASRVKRTTGVLVQTVAVPARIASAAGKRRTARRARRCVVAGA